MDKHEYRHSISIKLGKNHWMGEKVSDGNYGNTERNDGKSAECFLNVKFDVISQLDESIAMIPEIEERLEKLEDLAHRRVEMMLSKGGFITAEQMMPKPEPEPAAPAPPMPTPAPEQMAPVKGPTSKEDEEAPAHRCARRWQRRLRRRTENTAPAPACR